MKLRSPHFKPDELDRLGALLDEWQPEAPERPGFTQRLETRIAEAEAPTHRWAGGWRWRLPSVSTGLTLSVMLLLLVTTVVFLRPRTTQPAPAALVVARLSPATQQATSDPVVRDLQTFDQDADLLEHLDFLSAPAAVPAHSRNQD